MNHLYRSVVASAAVRPIVLLLALGGATACQSHDTAMLAVCEAPRNCTACMDAAPEERAKLIAAYIDQAVRNDEVKAFFSSLATMSPEDRVAALRKAAEADGLAGCMLADQWEP